MKFKELFASWLFEGSVMIRLISEINEVGLLP